MLWLYLLGAVTVLVIALRRVIHRQTPLSDELYSTKIAFDHLQSGVAWVRQDGTLGAINPSLATTLGADPQILIGRNWLEIFAKDEHDRLREAYARMLLVGKTEIDTYGQRAGSASQAPLNVLLVAVHDHKMRFVGHHCLILDSTERRLLEERLKTVEAQLKELERRSLTIAK